MSHYSLPLTPVTTINDDMVFARPAPTRQQTHSLRLSARARGNGLAAAR
jgi:hypothetical protein